MKTLIFHELKQFFYGIRLPVAFILTLIMFAVSSLTYIGENREVERKYHEWNAGREEQLRNMADNATNVANFQRSYQLPPRSNGFISDCGELSLPNTLVYKVFYYNFFERHRISDNPFLMPADRINWGFILPVLFSFLAILFSFDAVSGERERQTLALCLSNSVRRSRFLLGKFMAIHALLMFLALVGMLLAVILLMLSPAVRITGQTYLEIGLFLLFVFIFTGSMTAVGLFASVMSRNSNISLLLSVSLWLIFLLFVPNLSRTLSMTFNPLEKVNTLNIRTGEKRKEIEAAFPAGKWMSNDSNPFTPQHEIRANMMMAFAKNEYDIRTDHLRKQLNQVDRMRRWTWISPLAVFEYGQEALLDGGFPRLQKNYADMQNFLIQYERWFKDVDAKDDQSPHWYNPYEPFSTTRKAVAYEDIPQYVERSTGLAERLAETATYLLVMLTYMAVMLSVAFLRFERYPVK